MSDQVGDMDFTVKNGAQKLATSHSTTHTKIDAKIDEGSASKLQRTFFW